MKTVSSLNGLNTVSVLAINHQINYLSLKPDSEEFLLLEKKIKALEREIALHNNLIKGLQEEESLLNNNRKLGTETEGTTLEKVKEFATYYGNRIRLIGDEIFDTKLKIEQFKEEMNRFSAEIRKLRSSSEKETGEIVLKLEAAEATQIRMQISYNVSNAGWFPVYDIKAENTDSALSLHYKAHVYQQTGVNWNNSKITLSTDDPTIDNSKPDLTAYYLNYVNPRTYRNRTQATKKYKFKYNPLIKRVSGIVLDSYGQPLPGVSVVIKGTTQGVQTDFDGRYTLDITEGQNLSFSFVGQQTKEVPIYSPNINVRLEEDVARLEEVVVSAYGTSGYSPGIKVRGNSSVRADQAPLYIVDGVPQEDIGHIDQSEIKSTQILKGSDATALYGSKAASGVVLITTKGYKEKELATNKEFSIKKRYSIASVDDITVIYIDDFKVKTEYEYFSAPVLNENVFLTAKLTEWEQFDLLPGEANVYFGGSYSGKSFIDPYQVEKELTVSLGVDPNIVVERKQLNNFKSTTFIGGSKVVNKTYEISLKSNKSQDIQLTLMDRIPISQNKGIKVDDIEYGDAEFDKKKSLLSWKINLSPQKPVKKELSYTIKFPKYKHINL